jgi:hypothetical protein
MVIEFQCPLMCGGRRPDIGHDSAVTASAYGIAASAVSATLADMSSSDSSAAKRSRSPSIASAVDTSLAKGAKELVIISFTRQRMR